VWTSTSKAPAIARVLAFDEDGGSIVVVDARGAPRRVDLRTGEVTPPPSVKLTAIHSADGAAIYGVSNTGLVTRLTPTDAAPWTLRPPLAARDVAPEPDGSLLIVGDDAGGTKLWRVHPPASALLDTAALPRTERLLHTRIADQTYLASDSALRTIRTRDLTPERQIRFGRRIRAIAPTPSGDRIYVALDSLNALRVVDRYSDHGDASIALPGPPAELRMDPLGRLLLVRPAPAVDSAWVVAVGTDRVVGRIRTSWSADLPFVGGDGSIAVAAGSDVLLLDPQTLRPKVVVAGGARDFWIPVRWNGFRPRAPGLDQPVTFPGASSDSGDSILAAIRRSQADTVLRQPPRSESAAAHRAIIDSAQGRLVTPSPRVVPAGAPGYTVQFAALLDRDSARARARRISVGGRSARVIPTPRAGATVYLVVLGPFPSRAEAEAAGRAAKQPNPWVYEGVP
jgi:sporulation related protein